MNKKLKILIASVLGGALVAGAFIAAVFQIYSGYSLREHFRSNSLEVETVIVRTSDVRPVVVLQTEMISERNPKVAAKVFAPIGGKIKKCYVKAFEYVHMGQVLAEIDTEDLEMEKNETMGALQASIAKKELAEKNLFRDELLLKNEAISKQQYDADKSQLDAAVGQALTEKMKLERAESKIRDSVITASIDGYVIMDYGEENRTVNKGEVVFSIVDVSHVVIKVSMYSRDVSNFKAGERVVLRPLRGEQSVNEKYSGNVFCEGTVVGVAPIELPITGVYTVTIDLDKGAELFWGIDQGPEKYSPHFKEGFEVELPIQKNVVIIPDDAVFEEKLHYYVMVVDAAGIARRREVEVDDSGEEKYLQVFSNLQAGEQIIRNGINYVHEGEKVKVKRIVSY